MSKPSPRFRMDLNAVATETDGVATVEVTDLHTGTSFTFYEFEYALAQQMNGQPIDEIVAWAVANYETPMTAEAVEEFGAKLAELGFVEAQGEADGADSTTIDPAAPQKPQQDFVTAPMNVPEGGLRVESLDLSAEAITEISGKITSSPGIPKMVAGTGSGALSRGFGGERRQPPGPDSVEMAPFEDVSMRFRAPPPERKRSSAGAIIVVLGLLGGGGAAGYYYWLKQHPQVPQATRLHVVAPQPSTVYRWFATSGTVVDLEARTLAFETTGKIVELLPAGTKFVAGDTLGRLAGAKALEDEVATHKAKLAAFTQLRDSLKAAGKPSQRGELRDVEDKIVARQKMLDAAQTALNKLVLRAPEAGSIVETPAKVGTLVAAKAPALKWRGQNLHGDFTMDQEDYAKAMKLDFCRLEVSGLAASGSTTGSTPAPAAKTDAGAKAPASDEPRFVDCTIPPPGPPPPGVPSLLRKFIVVLPTDAGLVTGQQLRVARKRYDGVFVLPPSSVEVQTDVVGRVWVAAPNGTAEPRPVTIVEARDEVLVSEGINVGDEIITEPPRELTPGALVEPIR